MYKHIFSQLPHKVRNAPGTAGAVQNQQRHLATMWKHKPGDLLSLWTRGFVRDTAWGEGAVTGQHCHHLHWVQGTAQSPSPLGTGDSSVTISTGYRGWPITSVLPWGEDHVPHLQCPTLGDNSLLPQRNSSFWGCPSASTWVCTG